MTGGSQTSQKYIHFFKTATVVGYLDSLTRQYGNLFSAIFKSITADNGSEFADYDGLQRSVGNYLLSLTKLVLPPSLRRLRREPLAPD